ncbi:N-acetylated-alpha-linked acidic dipeptidase-like protein [Lates japonicus]|uniref:N-acetylated-alpha-linked acidic dipeptidase-like protein n=1 Tax=Lates japonicus TaxID=270547 RepID=A0AAD3NPG0_LATJO|nr:N-acetylated-alpha-linked acidic dipeptidase-like protein [Lates japonicus]
MWTREILLKFLSEVDNIQIQENFTAINGVIGVLVYTDPLDINGLMSNINETYHPHSCDVKLDIFNYEEIKVRQCDGELSEECGGQVNAPGLDSMSVYDNWIQYANKTSPAHGTIPGRWGICQVQGSDYAAFVHYLGITSMDIFTTHMTGVKLTFL